MERTPWFITFPSLKNDVIYGRPKGLPRCNKGKKGKKEKKDCCMKIVVVGAGVAGLAAADLLSKAGTVNQN